MRRFALPFALSVAIIASAPFIRELQELVFRTIPRHGVGAIGAMLGLLLLALLANAVVRIQEHRGLRYFGLVLVLLLLWLQIRGFSQDHLAEEIRGRVNISERIHIAEYGLLALLVARALRPSVGLPALLLPLLWVTIAGTLDEWVQWWAPRRTGEIRDVAMNVVAGATGTLFAACVMPPASLRSRAATWRPALRAAAVAVLVLAGFLSQAHLGFEIHDPEIGRFRSWYSSDGLRAAARNRAVAWDVPNPPTGREIWGLQDPYLEEAARHTQHRNESFRSGNWVLAWSANRILETYYAPYLDKRLPNGRNQRGAPHMLRQIEAKGAPGDPERYESPVLRERIWIRPRDRPFLALAASVAIALWVLGAWLGRFGRR